MAKIYISSTFSDLADYRETAYKILRKLRHDVIAMEDYVAADERPLKKCLQDVAACNLYVGLFAHRYGFVPLKDNPTGKSITELEYREAGEKKIPRLVFLLDETVGWPDSAKDSFTGDGRAGQCIADLRAELKNEKIVSFFKSPDHLAGLVSVAVQLVTPRRVAVGTAVREVKLRALETRLKNLAEEYEAASRQAGFALSEVDRLRLRRQLDPLEKEMEEVAEKIEDLQ